MIAGQKKRLSYSAIAGVALLFMIGTAWTAAPGGAKYQASAVQLELLNRQGEAVEQVTDGDTSTLRIDVGLSVSQPTQVQFTLDGEAISAAACTIPAGEQSCQTSDFPALGWHWRADGTARAQGKISAVAGGAPLGIDLPVTTQPRPVVMVHGFGADWRTWETYLGAQGYLAGAGIPGFAVGDGQVAGELNTGSLTDPTGRTNTIAQNAAILGTYIQTVLERTGAQQVDLVAHSMGGLISRYYIDRVMQGDQVGQLLMLGSPMAGTDCANLPVALGLYLPAALEIRPTYIRKIFNQQVTHRHGVPFYMLAGTPIVKALQSPCTDVPTDIAVSVSSATAIPLHAEELPVLHVELNTSERVFQQFVLSHLKIPMNGFTDEPDPLLLPPGGEAQQFTRVFTGSVKPGESQEVTIPIEAGVTLATFALYDTTRTLDVRVVGASGNEIVLDVEKNGVIRIDDPRTLVYLGYGFENPRPGIWKVTLLPSNRTPASGAMFAITARFTGGARLEAGVSQLLPQVGESVVLTARLTQEGQPLQVSEMVAAFRLPDGSVQERNMAPSAEVGQYQVEWVSDQAGLHGIEIRASGQAADGSGIERAASLALEAQPLPEQVQQTREMWSIVALAASAVLVVLAAGLVLFWLQRRRR